MANLWECIIDATLECELGTPSTTSNVTIYDLVRWANRGQDIIATKTDCIERLYTASTVANQQDYTLDDSFIRPQRVEWIQGTQSIYALDYKDIIKMRSLQSMTNSTGTPSIYTVFGNKLKIYPPVASSAGTASCTANITATATTITGITSTTNLASSGRALWDSEVISWTGKTSTTLTGVERGLEETTAAAHDGTSSPTTITERDIFVWGSARYKIRQMNIYSTGTCAFALGDATVTGTGTNFLANVNVGDQIGTGPNPSKWYTVLSVTSDVALELTSNFGEANVATTSYICSTTYDIPVENAELITLYLIFRIKKKLEIEPQASAYEQEFYTKVQELKADVIYNNPGEYPVAQDVDNPGMV
jgi:hypothetical protein